MARRAMRVARSAIRRVAGEVCKFESTPNDYRNTVITASSNTSYSTSTSYPLNQIVSGQPWIMPLNWTYDTAVTSNGAALGDLFYNGAVQGIPSDSQPVTVSLRNPIWYNTFLPLSQRGTDVGTELQYRLKYLYINALFNASIGSSENNSDGALRVVIIKDKQPTGGAATWFDSNITQNSRGVFNAQRIDAQLNPNTVGRFKIMYDKTLRFNNINGYKPFKYYKALSTVVRNNRGYISYQPDTLATANNYAETNDQSPPVQRNAYYLMLFSDGLNFSYSADPSTPAASFHLFNRVAYYNN